jgi:hypothetical protein
MRRGAARLPRAFADALFWEVTYEKKTNLEQTLLL